MITYTDSATKIVPEMLQGFFQGWRKPHTPEEHLEILKTSSFSKSQNYKSEPLVLPFQPVSTYFVTLSHGVG